MVFYLFSDWLLSFSTSASLNFCTLPYYFTSFPAPPLKASTRVIDRSRVPLFRCLKHYPFTQHYFIVSFLQL